MSKPGFRKLVVAAGMKWSDDGAMQMAAALAFYVIISLVPLLIVSVMVSTLFFSAQTTLQDITSKIQMFVGEQSAQWVAKIVANALKSDEGWLTLIISAAVLMFTATAAFAQLQTVMNRVWGVEPKPGHGWWAYGRKRLLSFLMVLGIGLMLIASLVIHQLILVISDQIDQYLPGDRVAWEVLNYVSTFIIVFLFFMVVYKFMPDAFIPLRGAVIGGLATTVLFMIGSNLIRLYFHYADAASTYGATRAAILLLLWIYYCSMIVLYGAEFTRAYTVERVGNVEPASYARWSPTFAPEHSCVDQPKEEVLDKSENQQDSPDERQ